MERIAARNAEWRYYLAWRLGELTKSYLEELEFTENHAQQVAECHNSHGYMSTDMLGNHFQNMERWRLCISSARHTCSV
jgi:hypothetical protein